MPLRTTGPNSAAIENDFSLGSFKSNARRVSFNEMPKVFAHDKNANSNDNASGLGCVCLGKEGADEKVDDETHLDSTFKKNQWHFWQHTQCRKKKRRTTRQKKHSNENFATPMLERDEMFAYDVTANIIKTGELGVIDLVQWCTDIGIDDE